MIDCQDFLNYLQHNEIDFFSGVPDSLLKDIGACIADEIPSSRHIIACNEGSAIALAIGWHLATNSVPFIYMQNSGIGNALNPLVSLADPQVYGIPMLLMIGWRAEIQANGQQLQDEPQHVKQGQVLLSQLHLLGIAYEILESGSDYKKSIDNLVSTAKSKSRPVAMVVRKGSFSPYVSKFAKYKDSFEMSREKIITIILANLPPSAIIVCTTGMASRELFEARQIRGENHSNDFLTVGGMGHASQIACGISLANPSNFVVCIDGDGAALMHLGALPYCARAPKLIHILINNGVHDSVGGQPTIARELRLADIAAAMGYAYHERVESEDQLARALDYSISSGKGSFIEVMSAPGHRKDLGRPTTTPENNKNELMQFMLEKKKGL